MTKISFLFDRARLGSAVLCCLGAPLLSGVQAHAQSSLVVNVAAGGDVIGAANQVLSAGGGTINLAPGTYNIKSSIVLGSNTTLNGAGSTTVLLGPPTPHTWPIITEIGVACSNITIENLVVDGNIPRGAFLVTPSGTDNPYSFNDIDLYSDTYNVNNVTLLNLELRNAKEGLQTGDGSNYLISNVYIHDNNPGSFAHNAYLTATSNVTITHSRFLNAHAGAGLHLNFGNTGILIQKSEFSGNQQEGLSNQSGAGNTFQDSIFNNNGVEGVYSGSNNVLVQRSVASYNGDAGFYNIGGSGQYNYLFGLGNVNGLDILYGLGGYGVTDLDQVSSTTPNVYEAEFADGPTGATDTADWTTAYAGFSGAGVVDFNANHLSNGLLTFSHVGVVSSGSTSITFRYSNGATGTLSMPLTVNGVAQTPISFPSTGSNSTWSTVSVNVPLSTGNNVIQIAPSGTASPEIDNLTVNTSTPSAPPAPTGLTATAVTPYQVNLAWSPVAGAATYNVYQNGRAVGFNVVGTTYTDSRIVFGKSTLSYTVVALNQGGSSAPSSAVSVTTPIDAPAGLQVAAGSGAGNYLNWMSANGASYYNVKRSNATGGPYTTLTGVTNTTNLTSTNFEQTYQDAAAAPLTTYYYVVSAVDANGNESPNSYEVSFLTPLTPQTITFNAIPSQAVGNTLKLTATASSGLPVSYTAVPNGNCSVSGATVTFLNTGNCGINASQAGNSNYAAAATVGQIINVVTPVAQAITFAAIPGQTSGTTLTLNATATSGLAVSYSSSTPGICTVSGSTAILLAGGTCTLTASQAGGANYAAATPVTQSFTVAPASTFTISLSTTTITLLPNNGVADALTVNPLNGFTGAVTLSLSGLPAGVSGSFYPSNPTTTGTNLVVYVPAGTAPASYPLTITGVSGSLTVSTPATLVVQGTQTITFAALAGQTTGGSLTLNATASSGLAVSYSSSTPSVCTVSGSTVTLIAAGTCTVTASQAGNAIYTAATPVSQSFTVAAKVQSQTITFNAIAAQTSGTSLALTATASSGLAVSYASSTPSVCTVSGSTASLLTGGSCTLTASQAGNSTYSAATSVSQSFTVLQSQTITFNTIATQHVGTPLNLTGYATASSGLPIAWTYVNNGNCTISGTAVTFINSGACGIIANQSGNSTYAAAANVGQVVQVAGALQSQTITFAAIPTQTSGTSLTLAATASSGLAISYASSTPGVCTVAGSTASLLAAGTCTVTASQSGNNTYAAATSVTQSFTVLQSQTITFNTIATQHVGTPLNLSGYATASSGLPITWILVNNGNCSISGTTVTFINPGACGIIANQAGNATYAAAAAVGQVVQVAGPLQSQTITFKAIATQKVGTPLNLSGYATASSGLAITWTYVNNGNCTISGTTVTFLNAGTCGIIANQAGNATYAAAAAVGQVVQVSN